jgi:predicted RNase H-like HicB family nuclease
MNTRTFHVTLTPDEDGWIVASVPALKGCHSQGKTREEALDNIREAIDLWLEVEDDKAISALPETDRRDLAVA